MAAKVPNGEPAKHCYSIAFLVLKQCYLRCFSNIKEKKRKYRENARRVPARDAGRVVSSILQARSFFGSFFVENFSQFAKQTAKTAIHQVMHAVIHNPGVGR
ncbi:hypothetical protein [Eggerthella guodeyinii]|uniref:Uncharacterized protein n=1 Tax=Eggerthella guodeyinii TaxID=2690837 RepID=A0A6N7RLN7_9ACTN|nr:hypothetical protein [Eggerthella guodeyinii]MRX82243.1 hypothetical protein [Eggerthella guodeyinii]